MSKDAGGPAFPVQFISQNNTTGETTQYQSEGGMTLRDYFAAKAMQGIISSPNFNHVTYSVVANEAYDVADAMLKERMK